MTAHFSDEQRAEIEAIVEAKMSGMIKTAVHDALTEFFTGYRSSTISFITQAAIVLTSITAIVYALKTMAAWVGITIMRAG